MPTKQLVSFFEKEKKKKLFISQSYKLPKDDP